MEWIFKGLLTCVRLMGIFIGDCSLNSSNFGKRYSWEEANTLIIKITVYMNEINLF